eukprot:symbB.v1.2.015606.t1/scaffold1172.1/size134038/3
MLALPMGKVESEVGFHATSCCSSRTKSSSRRVQSVVQVTRRGKYKYYLASAAVEGLRMVTKTVGSLEVALSFHSILVVIKQRTTFLSGSFEARFRAALSSTLSEFKVDPDSMGLKFIISLRVLWMKAPLRTPAYFVASQLEKGLQALDRLRKARGCARNYVLRSVDKIELDRRWQRIRGEYLDVMLEAGCKKEVVEDRLEILDQERSSKLQEQSKRWLSAKGSGQHSDHGLSFGRKRKRALDDASLMTQRQIEVLVSRWSRKQRLEVVISSFFLRDSVGRLDVISFAMRTKNVADFTKDLADLVEARLSTLQIFVEEHCVAPRADLAKFVWGTAKKVFKFLNPQQDVKRKEAWEAAKGMLKDLIDFTLWNPNEFYEPCVRAVLEDKVKEVLTNYHHFVLTGEVRTKHPPPKILGETDELLCIDKPPMFTCNYGGRPNGQPWKAQGCKTATQLLNYNEAVVQIHEYLALKFVYECAQATKNFWEEVESKGITQQHCTCGKCGECQDPTALSREARVADPLAKAAYLVAVVGDRVLPVGAGGCTNCGEPTASWCEGCYKRTPSRSPDFTRRTATSSRSTGSSLASPDLPSALESRKRSSWIPSGEVLEPNIEPYLSELLVDRSVTFHQFLVEIGIETCQDVRSMWASGQSMVEEYEQQAGGLPAEEAFGLALMYQKAVRFAATAMAASVATMVDERTSSTRQRPALTLEAAPTTSIPAKLRRIVAAGGAAGSAPVLDELVAVDPHTKEKAAVQVKLDSMFQFVLENLLDLRELGLNWQMLQDPVRLQQLKESLMAGPSRLSCGRLACLTSSMRRWQRFAVDKGYHVRVPTPLQIAEYLQVVNRGGPTAAASMYQVFRWFESSMGNCFHTDHFLIKPYRLHSVNHTGKQAVELAPWEFYNLVISAAKAAGTRLVLLCFMIMSAVSCIRFEHVQRSRLVKACLQDFLQNETLPTAQFLWPGLKLTAEDLWEVCDSTPFTVGKPMSRSRFLELLRGTLLEVGVPREEATSAGYNRLRRFLPTLGNCLQLDKQSMQSLGNWVEIPAGGGPQPATKEKATIDMSTHYSGQKTPSKRSSEDGYHGSPGYFAMQQFALVGAFEIPVEEIVEQQEIELPIADQERPVPDEIASSSDDGSHTSSSSASDETAQGEDLVRILPAEAIGTELPWFQQYRRVHLLKFEDEGRLVPWCRDKAFLQDPIRRGEGFVNLDRDHVCQRIILARIRAAYESGQQAIKLAAQVASKVTPDSVDEPLPESTSASLSKDFLARYCLTLDPALEPSDQLRARVYREFRKNAITVIPINKVKSILASSRPKSQEAVNLPGGLQLQFDREVSLDINSVISYYFGLRTLMYAWAWAGNYTTKDWEGREKSMVTLSQAMSYADERNYTVGSALEEALRQHHLEWRSPAQPPLASGAALERKRKLEDDPAPPPVKALDDGRRKIKTDRHQTVREPVHSFGGGQPACDALPHRHVTCQSDVSELLKAAKPVTWRGKGDLLQVAWGVPPKGTWLVIELWAGIGGLALSMLSIGCHFYGLAAELDPTAQACAKEVMPHVVHLSRVEHVKASDFSGILQRRKPRGVLVGGGSPCQGNSGLNTRRRGLADPRSQQPLELQRLFREFDELPEMQDVELIGLLENVASMPNDVRDEYSAWLGCDPVLIEAGTCGWAHRRRLYWLFNRTKGLGPQCSIPSEWAWITGGATPELRFVGKKPVPPRISWGQGYRPLFDAVTVIQQAGEGAFHPFTREFFHPDDRTQQSSPEAVARFYADARRFPPSAYEEGSLLWKSDQWRQPSADERSQIMGIPPAVTRSVPGSQAVRTQVRNSLLGNGFHLPSIMILLTLIPFLCEAKMSSSILPADEQALRDRVAGTVWEPGRLESFPGLKGVHELVDDLQHAFPEFPFPSELQTQLKTRLQCCALAQLQAFPAWLRGRGLDADGKQRAIDDARKSGRNTATCLHETIHTVHLDFIAAVAGMADRALPCKPPWFGCRLGTDDLPEAYRGLPVSEDQLRYSIVCIFLPGVGWRFSVMYGLAYGLGSAVISFNRFPSLGIAVSRRCTLAVAASYFDDELSLEFMLNHDVSQRGVQCVFTCMGAQPQAAKSFVPSANRHYLGASVHVGDLALDNLIRFQPKTSTVHKVNEKLQAACSIAALDRDTAGKLRGDVTWMFSLCAGNVGKVAGPLLSAKQHGDDPHLTADDIQVIRFVD